MSVSQQLIVPKLEGLVLRYRVTQDGGNKLPAKIYMILIFFCLLAGWGEHHGKQGWLQVGEDMCGRSRKFARFVIYICALPKVQDVFASNGCRHIGGQKCSYN
jgi:hypothetical protein